MSATEKDRNLPRFRLRCPYGDCSYKWAGTVHGLRLFLSNHFWEEHQMSTAVAILSNTRLAFYRADGTGFVDLPLETADTPTSKTATGPRTLDDEVYDIYGLRGLREEDVKDLMRIYLGLGYLYGA